ncbi:MAG: hypothetical protein IOC86_01400, partial [Aestuariivirga sp.]|nr:hypothetical protein [Aestuariivirga sp.]
INDGFVAGYAEAISTADLGAADDAEAFAFGAVFIGDENPNFTNNDDGTVYADAFASAYDTSLAVAGGLIQADGFNGISGATITNAGTIESNAEAKAGKNGQDGDSTSGPYDPSNTEARAWAVSLGAGQLVGDGLAGANFTNLAGADLTVLAAASAIDYSEATAGALGIGGAQIGLGLAGARLYGENDGIIDVEVDARAEIIPFNGNGDTVDTGDALAMGAGVGFLQVGLDVFGTGVADFTNTYEMNVDVYAEALTPVVDGYDAQALGIGLGAGQVIGTLIGNAYAEINNYDEIAVDVLSRATGGDASADSFGIGTLQIAAAGALGTASASLTNTSPDSIDVYAAAYASGLNADANAYVFGAGQVAFNLLGNATADVSNSGGILADAYALADAKYDANADADAAGVNQTVFSLFASDATINSSYYIEANAFAYASSSRSDAYASASASGANQFGVGGTLALNLTNQIGGTIDADATASAFAYETANASADAKGFEQNGTSFAGLSLSADNSGDMYVDALAIASGAAIPSDPGYVSASYAFAEANVAGSIQSGITTSGGLVLAGFGNSGVMDIEADAFAFAAYTAEADAGAFGASQDLASPSGDVYAIIENSGGYLRADAEAYASSFFGAAYASGLAVGAGQDATGRNVFLTASNSTSLRVDADGTAIAYDDWAYAEAQATGVDQEAFATAGRAAVYTENTSSIFVTADSYAVGYYAQAFAYATAIGVAQDADAENGVATAAINNSGIYDITGSAEAIAYSVYDAADAMAFARGVEQYADGGVRAVASVQNAAGIYGTAVAFAVSYDSGASANATGTGVFQDVYSENGTAVGVYQVAASYGLGLYSENAYADLENTGLIAADG